MVRLPRLGGAVEQDDVVVGSADREELAQNELLADAGGEPVLGPGELRTAGGDLEAADFRTHRHLGHLAGSRLLEQLGEGVAAGVDHLAERKLDVGLGVEVDEQDLLLEEAGQRRAEGDGGGGLADPALLGGHGDHDGLFVSGGERLGRDALRTSQGTHGETHRRTRLARSVARNS